MKGIFDPYVQWPFVKIFYFLISKSLVLATLQYRTRAIISRGLYISYPISKDPVFVFKEDFSEKYVHMYGLYSRASSNQDNKY